MFGLLKGKKALVTGAAQGIGKAVAKLYAEEGADVLLCDINQEKVTAAAKELSEATGRKCAGFAMDITKQADAQAAVQKAVSDLGGLDVVCNSAGILIHALMLDMTEAQWDKIFSVNLKGAFLITQAAAKVMVAQKHGKIVHVSSCSGKKPTREEAGYCATKSGLNGFMKVAALELGEFGINVNAICPGATDTEMVRSTFITSPEIEQEWIDKTALKRLGTVLDQARAVLFLSSELADHITGETIVVSAGEMMTQ
jgi:NAD(P)-dependent dehydrogenase (short-subunit alcohol dehydrogenase family)